MKDGVTKENIEVICDDGVLLKGMLLIPAEVKAVVQFNGGTALRKEFYLPFLQFLVGHGYLCCLWDYGVKDMPAVKSYLIDRFPNFPFFIVAHSAGGQQMGFMKDLTEVKGMVGFAISTGYFGYMPWRFRLLSAYFFYLFTPISVALTGYVAAKRFRYMEDLPKNVVLEWRSWCWKPDYFFNKKFYGKTVPSGTFGKYTFPIHVFWTSDDPISNKHSVPAYWRNIRSDKSITIQRVTPEEMKAKEIDHMGFFRKSFKKTIWREALEKLDSFLEMELLARNKG
jgi:predicted alpha/beta hydrolase